MTVGPSNHSLTLILDGLSIGRLQPPLNAPIFWKRFVQNQACVTMMTLIFHQKCSCARSAKPLKNKACIGSGCSLQGSMHVYHDERQKSCRCPHGNKQILCLCSIYHKGFKYQHEHHLNSKIPQTNKHVTVVLTRTWILCLWSIYEGCLKCLNMRTFYKKSFVLGAASIYVQHSDNNNKTIVFPQFGDTTFRMWWPLPTDFSHLNVLTDSS